MVYRNTYEAPDPQEWRIRYTVKATAEYTQMSDPMDPAIFLQVQESQFSLGRCLNLNFIIKKNQRIADVSETGDRNQKRSAYMANLSNLVMNFYKVRSFHL